MGFSLATLSADFTEALRMKPISKTAFYCCGVRMQDAQRPNPVCGDSYAQNFMADEGLQILERFKDEKNPNASNVARHRIIDDLLRADLVNNPDLPVVIIGAGFDSRGFRLHGGRWLELDEPQVIDYKNERLPTSQSQNQVQRIPIDFSNESLEDKLSTFSQATAVVVVIEGVFQYLEVETIVELLKTLQRLFPKHKLICDLMTRNFFENYGRQLHDKINDLGASFKITLQNPAELFLGNGYTQLEKIPIVEKSVMFENPELTTAMLDTFRATLPQGYDIFVFSVDS
jgi:methyltransferase (TIGR00027 family)